MKITKSIRNNILFLIIIVLLIMPQTRQPIQVFIHKGLALFSPSSIENEKQAILGNYNWKLKDINGHVYNFKEAKGKVVLINFWATWCPPCIAEMPSMQKLYDDYKDEIVFMFVSNEASEVVKQFLENKSFTFQVYNGITAIPETLKTNSIPRTFLIDKKGNIVIDKNGAANWNSDFVRSTIDTLLKE